MKLRTHYTTTECAGCFKEMGPFQNGADLSVTHEELLEFVLGYCGRSEIFDWMILVHLQRAWLSMDEMQDEGAGEGCFEHLEKAWNQFDTVKEFLTTIKSLVPEKEMLQPDFFFRVSMFIMAKLKNSDRPALETLQKLFKED